jgi:hypothetical protein
MVYQRKDSMQMKRFLVQEQTFIPFLLVCSFVLLLSFPGLVPQAAAQEDLPPLNCQAEYPTSQRVVLTCGFGGLWEGIIFVYNREQQVDPSRPWQGNVSQTDALWIFQAGPLYQPRLSGRASLIIDFQTDDGGLSANLYDDQNGDGFAAYSLRENNAEPSIKENLAGIPTVRVSTSENWWQRDRRTNFNLDITIDGPVRGDHNSAVHRYFDQFTTDGVIDFTAEVRDNNRDGVADYEYRDSPIEGNYVHTSLSVSNESRPTPISQALIWPLLSAHLWGFDQPYNGLIAPIQVDWQAARINTIGELVPSRGRPSNWFIYSINRVEKGKVTATNFESPFAFYNLSGIEDGFPDLQVRFEHFNEGEFVRDWREPVQSVRYSWDQFHRQTWDYKLDMLGRHTITDTVAFNDFTIQTLPYAKIPRWVMDHTWDQINFVAYEGPNFYYTSEGIYEWGVTGEIRGNYINGLADSYTLNDYYSIGEGFRGEYRIAAESIPRLYISSVDGLLHLRGAQGGLWKINDHTHLRYADRNDDSYLDEWLYTRVIDDSPVVTTTRQLNVAPSHIIYSDDQEVRLRETAVTPAAAESMPPATHDEWTALGSLLQAHGRAFTPEDLPALIEHFPGPELQISGATVAGYRAIGRDGFRFLLTLRPGFQVRGDSLIDIAGLSPATYVVTYDGDLQIALLTPPEISGQLHIPQTPVQLVLSPLNVALHKTGNDDLSDTTLEIWAGSTSQQPTLILTQPVTLRAGEPLTSALQWSPPEAGDWTLTPLIRDGDNQVALLPPVQVQVQAAPSTTPTALVLLSARLDLLPLIIIALLVFAAIVAYVVHGRWGAPTSRRKHESTATKTNNS